MSWDMLPASLQAALRAARGVLRWYWLLFALIPFQLLMMMLLPGYPRNRWVRAGAFLSIDVYYYVETRRQKREYKYVARRLARSRERVG